MTTEKKIEIMQAFLDGKVVERRIRDRKWRKIQAQDHPVWDWLCTEYRVCKRVAWVEFDDEGNVTFATSRQKEHPYIKMVEE